MPRLYRMADIAVTPYSVRTAITQVADTPYRGMNSAFMPRLKMHAMAKTAATGRSWWAAKSEMRRILFAVIAGRASAMILSRGTDSGKRKVTPTSHGAAIQRRALPKRDIAASNIIVLLVR